MCCRLFIALSCSQEASIALSSSQELSIAFRNDELPSEIINYLQELSIICKNHQNLSAIINCSQKASIAIRSINCSQLLIAFSNYQFPSGIINYL